MDREQKDGCPRELEMHEKQQRNTASWEEHQERDHSQELMEVNGE